MKQHAPRQPAVRGRYGARFEFGIAAIAGVILALMVLMYYLYYSAGIGREQPVPFSHRLHVTDKQLSCMMCHSGAASTPRAGVPPLETCMLCHSKIIVDFPPIVNVRQHYEQRKPVEWLRVNNLPDFVYFDHQVHVRAGFDCGRCHGDVSQMDRIVQAHAFKMGFCMQCHRDEGASRDCLLCHR